MIFIIGILKEETKLPQKQDNVCKIQFGNMSLTNNEQGYKTTWTYLGEKKFLLFESTVTSLSITMVIPINEVDQ